jgi:uncharacterized protein YjdB
MNRLLAAFSLVAALFVCACGGDSSTATTPTSTTAITPATTALAVGQSQTYTLSATPSPTTVTWVSSNTNALTIDNSGNATAVGVGASTITATGDAGQTATLTIQTLPFYQGNWIGTATVIACTDLVGFSANNYCGQSLGQTQQVTLSLTQSGLTMSGSMTKSEGPNLLAGTVSGAAGINGDITLTGTLTGLSNGSNFSLALISWNSFSDGTNMTGRWSGNLTSPQILGLATLQWSLNLRTAP